MATKASILSQLWKQTLGKRGKRFIIDKRWVLDQIPSEARILGTQHAKNVPGDIYFLGEQHLPDFPDETKLLWISVDTGKLFFEPPMLKNGKLGKTNQVTRSKEPATLLNLKGLGPKTTQKLHNAGILSFQDLIDNSSHEVAQILGRQSLIQITKWQREAKERLR